MVLPCHGLARGHDAAALRLKITLFGIQELGRPCSAGSRRIVTDTARRQLQEMIVASHPDIATAWQQHNDRQPCNTTNKPRCAGESRREYRRNDEKRAERFRGDTLLGAKTGVGGQGLGRRSSTSHGTPVGRRTEGSSRGGSRQSCFAGRCAGGGSVGQGKCPEDGKGLVQALAAWSECASCQDCEGAGAYIARSVADASHLCSISLECPFHLSPIDEALLSASCSSGNEAACSKLAARGLSMQTDHQASWDQSIQCLNVQSSMQGQVDPLTTAVVSSSSVLPR
jgi:hypothetical protein